MTAWWSARPFLRRGGAAAMVDLGTLVPDPASPRRFIGGSSAIAINGAGTIAGDSDTDAGPHVRTGAFFAANAAAVGMFPAQMTVLDVNDSDVVVGSLGDPNDGTNVVAVLISP